MDCRKERFCTPLVDGGVVWSRARSTGARAPNAARAAFRAGGTPRRRAAQIFVTPMMGARPCEVGLGGCSGDIHVQRAALLDPVFGLDVDRFQPAWIDVVRQSKEKQSG